MLELQAWDKKWSDWRWNGNRIANESQFDLQWDFNMNFELKLDFEMKLDLKLEHD